MKFTESMLESYAQPLSKTEDDHCKNAIRMVADALKRLGFTDDGKDIVPLYPDTYAYSLQLRTADSRRTVKLFVQGSYANNTNVRTQSDVDIAVIQEEVFRTKYRTSTGVYAQSDATYGFTTVPAPAKTFKDEVQECLEAKFGSDVERKNKSIKVHGNSYRKDADTVPSMRHRDYSGDYRNDSSNYVGGIIIVPDHGTPIINYPEQHIANGRKKNSSTNHHYKKMVRIIKKMRYLMMESLDASDRNAANGVNSFMLESLLWNIEDTWYINKCGYYSKTYSFSLLISLLKSRKSLFRGYKEANGIKVLCETDVEYVHLCNFVDQLERFYE